MSAARVEAASVLDSRLVRGEGVSVLPLAHLLRRRPSSPNASLHASDLRYLSLLDLSRHAAWRDVESTPSEGGEPLDTSLLFFARRASKDCPAGIWHTMCVRLATHTWLLMHPVGRDDSLLAASRPVLEDTAIATNLDLTDRKSVV